MGEPGRRYTLDSLQPLVAALRADGYTVVGPVLRDGAIILDELEHADQLPHGWGVEADAGTYRVHQRADRAAFAHSSGPQSWKRFLHPPRQLLFSAARDGEDVVFQEPDEPVPRYAFLGVRPCDLRAIATQDRVLGAATRYAAARAGAFIIVVNCTEPARTCFCVSAGGGPRAHDGFDLALTELAGPAGGDAVRYVAQAGSSAGRTLLERLSPADAAAAEVARAEESVDAAADRMSRALPAVDLRTMLAAAREASRWDDVAARCLACGNCTMACPTCFCTSVRDTTDLTGEHAGRWQEWASCFEVEFSYLHGGSVRTSTRGRYRQWLSHKLGTWHDQFGESGCVGCGRCIAWCPVGIDITVEANALALEVEDRL